MSTTFAIEFGTLPVAVPIRDHSAIDLRQYAERQPGLVRRFVRGIARVVEWLFGVGVLLVGLSLLAVVPLGQFLTLGYLLEAGGRVARSGRIRDGFIGVRPAARIGGAVGGCVLWWLPLWGIASLAAAAEVIDPGGPIAQRWRIGLAVAVGCYVVHVSTALLMGGRIRHFLSPFNVFWLALWVGIGTAIRNTRDSVWDVVTAMRLPYFGWLGLRGYVGGLIWLAIPLALLGQGHRLPALGVLGGLLLGIVVLYLPFLQARFAQTGRMRAFRELGTVRAAYKRAPLAFWFALLFLVVSAIPLYLMKIELIPREIVFLEGAVFLAVIFPARVLVGWALSRADRRDRPRHFVFRWAGRLAAVPVVTAYVLVVFASQHVAWNGIPSLYENHAFLLPVPFVVFWGE